MELWFLQHHNTKCLAILCATRGGTEENWGMGSRDDVAKESGTKWAAAREIGTYIMVVQTQRWRKKPNISGTWLLAERKFEWLGALRKGTKEATFLPFVASTITAALWPGDTPGKQRPKIGSFHNRGLSFTHWFQLNSQFGCSFYPLSSRVFLEELPSNVYVPLQRFWCSIFIAGEKWLTLLKMEGQPHTSLL